MKLPPDKGLQTLMDADPAGALRARSGSIEHHTVIGMDI
jgi:hypothetical protein